MRIGFLKLACLWAPLLAPLACSATATGGLSGIWRQTSKINQEGFLAEEYEVEGCSFSMRVRQVPGDGNCLFHAISACLEFACNGTHLGLNLQDLMPKSEALRKTAVDYLVEDMDRSLYLENGETVPAIELLNVVAEQYNMTAEKYCRVMRKPSVWGGGPEIVALCNALGRPIHVYELGITSLPARSHLFASCYSSHRMACFGSPCYDNEEPIHILSADSRFPNLKAGRQLPNGNHFLSLFPCSKEMDGVLETTSVSGGGGEVRLQEDSWWGRVVHKWKGSKCYQLLTEAFGLGGQEGKESRHDVVEEEAGDLGEAKEQGIKSDSCGAAPAA
ncbi:unnamed protein product [Chrysoparadoxa australica]